MGWLATARRIKTAGRPRQPLLGQNRRFSSPHPFGRAGLARFEPRRLVSTSERRLPGENVCYLRNLGTDEPLTSMNGMTRGRATSSLSQNRQNRRNREPTRTGSCSGSCTDPRHRPTGGGRYGTSPSPRPAADGPGRLGCHLRDSRSRTINVAAAGEPLTKPKNGPKSCVAEKPVTYKPSRLVWKASSSTGKPLDTLTCLSTPAR